MLVSLIITALSHHDNEAEPEIFPNLYTIYAEFTKS